MPRPRRRHGWISVARVWLAVDLLAGRRLRACPHRMAAMSDGPICVLCGRFWRWED